MRIDYRHAFHHIHFDDVVNRRSDFRKLIGVFDFDHYGVLGFSMSASERHGSGWV